MPRTDKWLGSYQNPNHLQALRNRNELAAHLEAVQVEELREVRREDEEVSTVVAAAAASIEVAQTSAREVEVDQEEGVELVTKCEFFKHGMVLAEFWGKTEMIQSRNS